jgi:hypothetical protein
MNGSTEVGNEPPVGTVRLPTEDEPDAMLTQTVALGFAETYLFSCGSFVLVIIT